MDDIKPVWWVQVKFLAYGSRYKPSEVESCAGVTFDEQNDFDSRRSCDGYSSFKEIRKAEDCYDYISSEFIKKTLVLLNSLKAAGADRFELVVEINMPEGGQGNLGFSATFFKELSQLKVPFRVRYLVPGAGI